MTTAANPNRVLWIETRQQPLCDVPWLGTSVILSDGNVNFCCFSNAVVGNVHEVPFEQIWHGTIMRRIRHALSEQQLPPECQVTSCPIYRHDDMHYIFNRMRGSNSFKATGTHDPHAWVRERLQRSELRVDETRAGDTLEVSLEFHYQGAPMVADLFVGIWHPDHGIRFLPNYEDYAIPFRSCVEFSEECMPLRFKVCEQRLATLQTIGDYQICAALFENNSNPNLVSNCYWSMSKTFHTQDKYL